MVRRAAVVVAELLILALTVRATLRSSKLSDNSDDHVIGLWIVTAVLIAPTAWFHYMVLLLFPFAVLVRQLLRGAASPRAAWLAVASYLITESLMAVYIGFGQLAEWTRQLPYWTKLPSMVGWPLSLLLAYAAAYFLVIDRMPRAAARGRESRRRPHRREAV